MGFFAEFNTWLNALLAGYIGDNTARIAAAMEPVVVTLAVIYVMVWGYLQLTGQIEEAFISGTQEDHHAGRRPGVRAASLALQHPHCRHFLQRALPARGDHYRGV